MVSRSRASRKASRAPARSPAAASRRASWNRAAAALPSPSGARPASLLAVVHTSTGTPAAFAPSIICPRCVRRFLAAASRSGESGAITDCPTICSMSVRSSSAPRWTTASKACTMARPRTARISGSAHVGIVPTALIDAVP